MPTTTNVSLPQMPADDAFRRKVRFINRVDQVTNIPDAERAKLRRVAEQYVFRANDYYLELIDWHDPHDPIKQLIIPRIEELNDWGNLDASNESANTKLPGVQHKYPDTVLLLCNEVCGAYCRYCFRKRLFMADNEEVSKDISAGLEYIRQHPEVTNVLLTGGDPLIMSSRRLTEIFRQIREIEHVQIIRIGSKMPAFDPFRILNDTQLQDALRTYSTPEKRIYLMAHFDHPRELTPAARAGLAKYIECGVICVNQCPLIRGVNDDAETLSEMWRQLSFVGCPPYYLFQGRPTAGNEPFELPIVAGWRIYQDAVTRGSGLAGRVRFAMSHETGKIEVAGVDDDNIYFRYHRARNAANRGQFFVCQRDDDAYWLDQLTPAPGSYVPVGVRFADRELACDVIEANGDEGAFGASLLRDSLHPFRNGCGVS